MKPIQGPGGKLKGYIKETAEGQDLLAPGGRLLGKYIESKDVTLLPGGVFYGYGNQLMLLLCD